MHHAIFRSKKYKELKHFCLPELSENYKQLDESENGSGLLDVDPVLVSEDCLVVRITAADVEALVLAAQRCVLLSHLIKVVGQGRSIKQALQHAINNKSSSPLVAGHSWSCLKAVGLHHHGTQALSIADRHLLHLFQQHISSLTTSNTSDVGVEANKDDNKSRNIEEEEVSKALVLVQLTEESFIIGWESSIGYSSSKNNSSHVAFDPGAPRSLVLERAPTSMLPDLAFLTCTLAHVGPWSVVLDPCCGSGTLLHAATAVARCGCGSIGTGSIHMIGSDADKAFNHQSLAPLTESHSLDSSTGISTQSGYDGLLGDVCQLRIRPASVDVIVVDPPYGYRAAAITASSSKLSLLSGVNTRSKESCMAAIEHDGELGSRKRRSQEKEEEAFGCVITEVWRLAGQALVPGGRLACWLPHSPTSVTEPNTEPCISGEARTIGRAHIEQLATSNGLQLVHYLVETRSSGLLRALAVAIKPNKDCSNSNITKKAPLTLRTMTRRRSKRQVELCRIENEELARRRQTPYKLERSAATGKDIDIWRASWLGDTAAVKSYMEAGGDCNARDSRKKQTPLQFAAGYNKLLVVELLLSAGADACLAEDKAGMCALTRAAARGHVDVVRALLKKGADPGQRCRESRQTALMYAAQFGHLTTVQAILDHFLLDEDIPTQNTNESCIGKQAVDTQGLVDLLLLQDVQGCTALHLTAQWGKAQVLDLLLSTLEAITPETSTSIASKTIVISTTKTSTLPIDPDLKSSLSRPLSIALVNMQTGCGHGWTLAHIACRWGHVAVLKVLKQHGADFTVRDFKLGRSVLQEAEEWKRQGCIDWLRSAGVLDT